MRTPRIFNREEHIVNGKYHRVDGPAVKHINGYESWFFEDEYHRDGGPALYWGDVKIYANHGYLHNIDGPAVFAKYHGLHRQHFLYGYRVTKEEHEILVEDFRNHLNEVVFKFEIFAKFKHEKRHRVDDYYFA